MSLPQTHKSSFKALLGWLGSNEESPQTLLVPRTLRVSGALRVRGTACPGARKASTPATHPRPAFTLIELLVAISILLILTVITVTAVNVTIDKDRVPGGAREVQSFLQGARDRAIYSTQTLNPGPRGVRFLRDPNNRDTVTSMMYIGPPQKFSEGVISIGDSAGNQRLVVPLRTNWVNLELRKLLVEGARIEIPKGSGIYYTLDNINPNNAIPGTWALTKAFPASQFPSSQEYQLELEPAVLPNQEPRLLPRNVVIDLYVAPDADGNGIPDFFNSQVPLSWYGVNSDRLDLLFSPKGVVTGNAAVQGYLHLTIADVADAEQDRITGQRDFAGVPGKEGAESIVTINTRTGNVSVHPVNPIDQLNNANGANGADGIPDDPFFFAETGEESQ